MEDRIAEVVPLYGNRASEEGKPRITVSLTNDPMPDDKWRRLLTLLFTDHERSAA